MNINELVEQKYKALVELEGLIPSTNQNTLELAKFASGRALMCPNTQQEVVMFLLVTDVRTKKTYSLTSFMQKYPEVFEEDNIEDVISHYFSYGLSVENNVFKLKEDINSYSEDDWYYQDLLENDIITQITEDMLYDLRKINYAKDNASKQKLRKQFCTKHKFNSKELKLIEDLGSYQVVLQAV